MKTKTAEETLNLVKGGFERITYQIAISAMKIHASEQCQKRDEEIKRLKFMIDNGLGWEDMQNDITMPHEI